MFTDAHGAQHKVYTCAVQIHSPSLPSTNITGISFNLAANCVSDPTLLVLLPMGGSRFGETCVLDWLAGLARSAPTAGSSSCIGGRGLFSVKKALDDALFLTDAANSGSFINESHLSSLFIWALARHAWIKAMWSSGLWTIRAAMRP